MRNTIQHAESRVPSEAFISFFLFPVIPFRRDSPLNVSHVRLNVVHTMNGHMLTAVNRRSTNR